MKNNLTIFLMLTFLEQNPKKIFTGNHGSHPAEWTFHITLRLGEGGGSRQGWMLGKDNWFLSVIIGLVSANDNSCLWAEDIRRHGVLKVAQVDVMTVSLWRVIKMNENSFLMSWGFRIIIRTPATFWKHNFFSCSASVLRLAFPKQFNNLSMTGSNR